MAVDGGQCAQKVLTLLLGARADNSRMVAAAIGGHLSALNEEAEWSYDVSVMTDLVRDRCVRLLTELRLGRNAQDARRAAIEALGFLQDTLSDADDPLRPVRPALNRRVFEDVMAGVA